MRIAVVGAGSMGAIYARIVADNPFLELAAIIGKRPERVDRLASCYGTGAFYEGNVAAALSQENDLDALIVATPEWIRIDPIREILNAGKHLLYEKPLATDYGEAKKLYEMFQAADPRIVSMPVFSLRFTPQFAAGFRKVYDGDIGEIRHVSSRRNGNRSIAQRIIGKISPFYWLSPHEMDLLRWFIGDEVEWVEAVQYQGKDELDGYLLAHLRMKNGVDVQHMVSWCTPEISGIASQTTFEVFGSQGMLKLSENQLLGSIFRENNQVELLDTSYAPVVEEHLVGPFKNLVDHFVRCIIKGETPSLTVDDALASVRICTAMKQSAKESRRFFMEELS